MSTNFVSLLPFLKALQRNQNMPDDDDDSTPPVDQFGHVLPLRGNGVPPQSANTGRSGDPGVAPAGTPTPYPTAPTPGASGTPTPGTPLLLMQLLQAGTYPSAPTAGGPGNPQSSNPNQAQATNNQATNDNDDSTPPVDPSGLIGVVPGASQSNMQSDAIGNIVRSMTPGALPVYPRLQQAAAQSSKPDPQFVRSDDVMADEQAALEKGQATQPPVSDAQRKAGLVIRVGQRPLLPGFPVDLWDHTYLEIPRLDQDGHPVYDTDGNVVYDSYGILGQWDYKKGDGTTKNQQVTKDDIHSGRNGLQLRNEPKPGSDRNALYEIAVTPDQLAALKAGAEHWSQWQTTGEKCPSCGKDYALGGPITGSWRPAYNSNTWVYNMLIHNPAGRIEPPSAINKHNSPGWEVNDVSKDYYPGWGVDY